MNEREQKISEITTLIQAIEILANMIAEKTADNLAEIIQNADHDDESDEPETEGDNA